MELNGPFNHQGWGGRLRIKSKKDQSRRYFVFSQSPVGSARGGGNSQGLEGLGSNLSSPVNVGHPLEACDLSRLTISIWWTFVMTVRAHDCREPGSWYVACAQESSVSSQLSLAGDPCASSISSQEPAAVGVKFPASSGSSSSCQ